MSLFPYYETDLMKLAKGHALALHKEGISIHPEEGQWIAFMLGLAGCRRFVEIGTLTGYSSLWIHQALPADGELWTLEKNPEHIEAAKEVFAAIPDHSARIHLVEGDARERLEELKPLGPFDGVFIDGNKGAYLDYLLWAEGMVNRGGLFILDNLYLGGGLLDPEYKGKFSKRVITQMKEVVEKLSDRSRYRVLEVESRDGLTLAQKLF